MRLVPDLGDVLGGLFSVTLFLLLITMIVTTYVLARRTLIINLREIYFFHNHAFTRAWHLVIAGMTLFVANRALTEAERLRWMTIPEGVDQLFLFLFGFFLLLAFIELLLVFRRYLPRLGSNESDLAENLRRHLQRVVQHQDEKEGIQVGVTKSEDIYRGRPTLGPQVHVAHYRGIVLGMTRYLERRFGHLGDALLETVGRQTGRQAAKDMLDEHQTRDASIQQFMMELRTALVAIPSVAQTNGKGLRVRFDECALCSGIEPTGTSQCHYLTGLVRGLFEILDGDGVVAEEIECCAKGDGACVVEVTQRVRRA
jgi:predicted hydrocarbon binding protein